MNNSDSTYPVAAVQSNRDYKTGILPESAPLAVPYVPFQRNDPPKYDKDMGLIRGTMYPGLDLPYRNEINKTNPEQNEALRELMEFDFLLNEMALYLDTHEDDTEVFHMYRQHLSEAKAARDRYVKMYGPVDQMDMESSESYTWLKNPWPWDFTERMD